MKKILCLILVLILSVSVITACGNNDTKTQETENDMVTTSDEKNENKEESKEEAPSPDITPATENTKKDAVSKKSDDKVTVSEEKTDNVPSGNSSDFYLILSGTNEESILYHTGACPLLKDREVQKTSWEMIEMLQFRHCAKCNPPKYNGYVE